jgi:hypothetical protein
MNLGAGRLITTAAGYFTTITGHGVRAASFTRSAVGGGPRSSPLSSISRLAITFAGIRWVTTNMIHTRDVIVMVIVMTIPVIPVAVEEVPGDRTNVARRIIRRGVA